MPVYIFVCLIKGELEELVHVEVGGSIKVQHLGAKSFQNLFPSRDKFDTALNNMIDKWFEDGPRESGKEGCINHGDCPDPIRMMIFQQFDDLQGNGYWKRLIFVSHVAFSKVQYDIDL